MRLTLDVCFPCFSSVEKCRLDSSEHLSPAACWSGLNSSQPGESLGLAEKRLLGNSLLKVDFTLQSSLGGGDVTATG